MKLNIKAYGENGKIKSCSDNEAIVIDFHFGNTKVSTLTFKLEEGTGGHNWEITKGKKPSKYICSWCNVVRINPFPVSDETGDTYCPDCNWTLKECEEIGLSSSKGKKQKGEHGHGDTILAKKNCPQCQQFKKLG